MKFAYVIRCLITELKWVEKCIGFQEDIERYKMNTKEASRERETI